MPNDEEIEREETKELEILRAFVEAHAIPHPQTGARVDLSTQTAVDCDAGDEAPKQSERPSTSTPSAGWGRADRSYRRSSTVR